MKKLIFIIFLLFIACNSDTISPIDNTLNIKVICLNGLQEIYESKNVIIHTEDSIIYYYDILYASKERTANVILSRSDRIDTIKSTQIYLIEPPSLSKRIKFQNYMGKWNWFEI